MPPNKVVVFDKGRQLRLQYGDTTYELSAEYLRVYSPSAEVRGHGGQNAKIVGGKKNVSIEKVEPNGNYAICIVFNDGHDSGIYTWEYLHQLSVELDKKWAAYLENLDINRLNRGELTLKNLNS